MGYRLGFIHILLIAYAAYSQTNCDQDRVQSTWQNTTLFELTYRCTPVGWEAFFSKPEIKTEIQKISDKLHAEVQAGNDVNPAIGNVFRALYTVPPSNIRCVVMGQDPAPTKGEATGLSFSLAPATPSSKVASVQRVMLEAMNEGFGLNLSNGDLSAWADQGVLLLNSALTIPCAKDAKSCKIGGHLTPWKKFSKALMIEVDHQEIPMTFILWGDKAAKVSTDVSNPLHHVIKGGHPSPLAPGAKFFCRGYFSCSNTWLTSHNVSPVNWSIGGAPLSPPCIWTKGNTPKCTSVCTIAACE
jgi:uracil-DNA glycosylase